MLLKLDCYMEKFSDPYGTTAFQGTPLKKFSSNKSTKEAFHRKDYKAKEDNT